MSIEKKSSIEEGGDVYLDSIGTHSESDFWLIDSRASFHMTPHKEWFYEYERYNGNVFLGDDSPKKITGRGRVKLFLKDGRTKTILSVLHISDLAKTSYMSSKWSMQVLKLYLKKIDAKLFEEQWY